MIICFYDYLHICVTKFYTNDFFFNVECLVVSIIYNHLKNNEDFKIKMLTFQYIFNAYIKIQICFKYKKDSVLVVSEDEYKECKATKPQLYSNNQDTVFKLDRPGLFYFISGVSGQCEKGQKMIIKVMETESSPDSPSPSSSFSSLSASTHKKSSALKTAVQFTSSSFVVLIVSVLVWH
ncbi:hypothetical protein Bca52824_086287 [Brassica carinata]|uniref:Phytocyanin domain-containing protein n=1 Tax=Brassica carinata TaxID=52824 RepID=A0A8X7TM44_BRACI|nr:hypothetical protein Bca52824_086287 [Brassica carinata]